MRSIQMSVKWRTAAALGLGTAMAVALTFQTDLHSQTGSNPYRSVDGLQAGQGPGRMGGPWAKLPAGRKMGSPGGIEIDVDGAHLWAIVRCGNDGTPLGSQTYCDGSDLNPILRFDPQGNVVAQFGSRLFSWPHGLHIDRDGNLWVTEAGNGQQTPGAPKPAKPIGHQVFKFSPQGKLLMTLGEAGVAGNDSSHFNAPSDVITNANGDIFVVDGHNSSGNNRIVKLSKDGKFIKAFGSTG